MLRGDLIYNYPLYSLKQFRNFLKYSKETALQLKERKEGHTVFSIMLDMLWCNLRYGAMDSRDYLLFELYKKSGSERRKYFTKRKYFKLIKTFDKETFFKLIDKPSMYKEYAEFINRDILYVDGSTDESVVLEFLNKYQRVLIKPYSSEQGGEFIQFVRMTKRI